MPRLMDVEYKEVNKPQKAGKMKRPRRLVKIEWKEEPKV